MYLCILGLPKHIYQIVNPVILGDDISFHEKLIFLDSPLLELTGKGLHQQTGPIVEQLESQTV